MKGNHFTSRHLPIASEPYPQLLTAIRHGPLGRSAPCCTPPDSMFTQCSWNQCPGVIALNALPCHGSTLSRSSIKSPPSDQLIEGLLSHCDVSMTPTMALQWTIKEWLPPNATNKMTSYLHYRKKKVTIYRDQVTTFSWTMVPIATYMNFPDWPYVKT